MIYFLYNKIERNDNMNVGFDIDGILTKDGCGIKKEKEVKDWKYFLENYLNKKLNRNNNSYNFAEAYDFKEEKLINFFNNEMVNIIPKFTFNKSMLNIANFILDKNQDNNIYIITARENRKDIKRATIKWLNKHQFPYHNIYFSKQKGKLAKGLNIKYFFEDNIEHARKLSQKGIKICMLGKYHNQPFNNPNHPAFLFENDSNRLYYRFIKHLNKKEEYL